MAILNLRRLGVRGKDLPAKRTRSVVASDFSIGGMLIECERMYDKPFKVSTPEEFATIFGANVNPNQYGNDAVKGFFDNVIGVSSASLIIQALVGYDTVGDAIDAVNASRNVADAGAVANAFVLKAAYQDELQYGASGNRIGTKVSLENRFVTGAASGVPATGQSYAELDSVVGMRVGDLIEFKTTLPSTASVYKIITEIDESKKRVYWVGDFEISGGSGELLTAGDSVVIPGFRIQTYYKSINGVETEVDTDLGSLICSSEPTVDDFYVGNIFKSSKYIQVTSSSVSTLGDRLPVADAAVTYPTNGADGTAVVSVEAENYHLNKFNDQPIRFLANPETTTEAMQKALIDYSKGRNDTPIVLVNIPENRNKSQLKTIGQSYQSSASNPAVIVANWLKVTDPFSKSAVAPPRNIPNVGHSMGVWVRTIGVNGIHFIPATDVSTLSGVLGVVGDQFLDDGERTDIAEAGVNLIQERTGIGIKIANFFALSTDEAYLFANSLLMRNFIKVSAEDSLAPSENTPNSLNRIKSDKMAILSFLYGLWFNGSSGNVPEGETFGRTEDAAGNPTTPEDHFEVVANTTNNSPSSIQLGERNIHVYFTFPAPASSIEIGVGIMIKA